MVCIKSLGIHFRINNYKYKFLWSLQIRFCLFLYSFHLTLKLGRSSRSTLLYTLKTCMHPCQRHWIELEEPVPLLQPAQDYILGRGILRMPLLRSQAHALLAKEEACCSSLHGAELSHLKETSHYIELGKKEQPRSSGSIPSCTIYPQSPVNKAHKK